MHELSVVLPTYNERQNIEILIPRIEDVFKRRGIDGEILVVDDSSPDGTAGAALELNKKYGNIRVLVRKVKEGPGTATREGYNNCNSKFLLSMDSDLAFDPETIPMFLDKLRGGYGLVVGSRHAKGGGYEKLHKKTWIKGTISKLGNIFTQFVVGIPITDFSINYRAISRKAWESITTHETHNSFFLEMIIKAKKAGWKITEVPVTFKDRIYGESKLALGVQPLVFLRKVLKWRLLGRF